MRLQDDAHLLESGTTFRLYGAPPWRFWILCLRCEQWSGDLHDVTQRRCRPCGLIHPPPYLVPAAVRGG